MKIYVGYDSREDIAWQVCRHSLHRHAGDDLPVFPLKQSTLRELGLYTRPVDAKASTEFSTTFMKACCILPSSNFTANM